MKKSDLHTGMLVTIRNGDYYYVALNTGFGGEQENVLIHKVGKDTGWLALRNYDDNLLFHDIDDDILPTHSEEDDREWDIIRVDACSGAGSLYCPNRYRVIWERSEET